MNWICIVDEWIKSYLHFSLSFFMKINCWVIDIEPPICLWHKRNSLLISYWHWLHKSSVHGTTCLQNKITGMMYKGDRDENLDKRVLCCKPQIKTFNRNINQRSIGEIMSYNLQRIWTKPVLYIRSGDSFALATIHLFLQKAVEQLNIIQSYNTNWNTTKMLRHSGTMFKTLCYPECPGWIFVLVLLVR